MNTVHTIINRIIESIGKHSNTTVFTTSFSPEDQLITYAILESKLPITIATLDTGRLFPETYELWQLTEMKYNIAIHAAFPKSDSIQTLLTKQGINGFYNSVENRKACCFVRKVEPLNSLLEHKTHWITGLRSEQSENRNSMQFKEYDAARALHKIQPIIDYSYQEVLELCQERNIPLNTLHEKGYPSIGCQPCTRAITEGEHPRAGRWWWENGKQECGLHLPDKKKAAS